MTAREIRRLAKEARSAAAKLQLAAGYVDQGARLAAVNMLNTARGDLMLAYEHVDRYTDAVLRTTMVDRPRK